jgi:AcrR family transcriptional regulator
MMGMTNASDPGTRDIAREAVRASIASTALDLFLERGFDDVTIADIAQASGTTPRTFHRYFSAKEDTVVTGPALWQPFVAVVLEQSQIDSRTWESLREAFKQVLEQPGMSDPETKRTTRVLMTNRFLRARNLERQLDWTSDRLRERSDAGDSTEALQLEAIAHAAVACFNAAMAAWADDSTGKPATTFLDRAFSAPFVHQG